MRAGNFRAINQGSFDGVGVSQAGPACGITAGAVRAKAEVLIPIQAAELQRCERILTGARVSFFDQSLALMTIRKGRLYRAQHENFDLYCRKRLGFGRAYASRLIAAAKRLILLPANASIPRPANEYQVRPLLRLEPEVFPNAWAEVVKRADGGRITSSFVKRVIDELRVRGGTTRGKGCKNGWRPVRSDLAEMMVWLDEVRRRLQKDQPKEALAAVERVEAVLERYL